MKLASGKENSRRYAFGWWIGDVNGHRTIEHSGAWQGFTSDMTRYPDDDLTVAIFVNLDAAHARPDGIGHVVAGLVAPALMPPRATPLPDDPRRVTYLRTFLTRVVAGGDVASDYDAGAGYKPDPLEKAELAAALPAGWQDAPMTLVEREDSRGGVRYAYRTGPTGDTRQLVVLIAPSGRVLRYVVLADPDAR